MRSLYLLAISRALKAIFFLTLFASVPACGKRESDSLTVASKERSEIQASDISAESCLSLPKLFQNIRSLRSDLPSLSYPTSIVFESSQLIRAKFKKGVAFGHLTLKQQPISAEQNLPDLHQEGCSRVTLIGRDKEEKEFEIKESSSSHVMAEAADGERIHYVWISSKSFQTRRRYLAFDLPCGDEQHPIFVTVSRTVDWTRGDFPELAPANGSTFSIEEGFLRLAAGAAGVDIDRFYKLNADGSRLLDLSSVKSLEKMSTDPDLQSCADEQRNLIF